MVPDEHWSEEFLAKVLEDLEARRQAELAMPAAIRRLNEFVSRERARALPARDVEFGNVFRELLKYRQFLGLIVERYNSLNAEIIEHIRHSFEDARERPGTRQVTREEIANLERNAGVHLSLHLQIEGFYLFARILLDKILQVFIFYFGGGPYAAMSHTDIVKVVKHLGQTKFEAYAAAKNLSSFPESLREKMLAVVRDVVEFRDDIVAHHKNPRGMKATGFQLNEGTTGGTTYIIYSRMNPREGDRQSTGLPLPALLQLIDGYLLDVLVYMEANRDKAHGMRK